MRGAERASGRECEFQRRLRRGGCEPSENPAAAAEGSSDFYIFRGTGSGDPQRRFPGPPVPRISHRVRVVDLDGDDLAVEIYVDRSLFQAQPAPAVGDVISRTLWLQGCLAE